ncbi:GTPase activating protein [Mycoemilia scoparia]|uniref:GTPase activating protein n=1 Tax=Mycoemilia scoparia TaxID=417184 RepID=A0A9W8AB67_9FUNG|nr:GTPase activating protein [Mycoemilia scoparia]
MYIDDLVVISSTPLQLSTCTSATSYTFCEPLDQIGSLLVQPPSFTHWYGSVIVTLQSGTALPPLWFHDDESASRIIGQTRHWGGDELVAKLSSLVEIKLSTRNPNLYLLNNSDLRQEEKAAQAIANLTSSASTPQGSGGAGLDISRVSANLPDMQPFVKQAKEWQWNMLEQFSRITRVVRDATSKFQEQPLGKRIVPMLPTAIRPLGTPTDAADGSIEYESARLYLARWAAQNIMRKHDEGFNSQNDLITGNERLSSADGAKSNSFHSVWEELVNEMGELGSFEVLSTNQTAKLPEPLQGNLPLSAEGWFSKFSPKYGDNSDEVLQVDKDVVLKEIFAGGIEEDIRPVLWKYLHGIYPWKSTDSERKVIDSQLSDEYWKIKSSWVSNSSLKETKDYQEQVSRIDKDVLRTDRQVSIFSDNENHSTSPDPHIRQSSDGLPSTNSSLEQMKDILLTYHYYDKAQLGYVQGMSDLLAPIYAVMLDEPTSFWCFVAFMKRMRRNFVCDQSGMHEQLNLMRELVKITNPQFYQHLDIQRLWEVLWTDYLSDQFVLFVALAILQRHADIIMDHLCRFDETLKYINDLSETIDLRDTLRDAEMLFYKLEYRLNQVEEKAQENGPDTGLLIDLDDTKPNTSTKRPSRKGKEREDDNNRPEGPPKETTEPKAPQIPQQVLDLFKKRKLPHQQQ